MQPEFTMHVNEFLLRHDGERVELVHGAAMPMADEGREHHLVVGNVVALLKAALQGLPGAVFAQSVGLKIGDETVLYPDAVVTQDPNDLCAEALIQAPTLVVEVSSPESWALDAQVKPNLYFTVPAVVQYMVVELAERCVTVHVRRPGGAPSYYRVEEDGQIDLAFNQATLRVKDLFEGLAQ